MLKIAPKKIIPLQQTPPQPEPPQVGSAPADFLAAMAAAQGGQGQPGQDPEPDPNDPNEAQEGEGQDSPGSVDPSIAGYMTSDYGPFMCQYCVHFLDPNACHVVAGNIDPQGCCNMFTPPSGDQQDQQGPSQPGQAPDQGEQE